jgi:hypothetical protein
VSNVTSFPLPPEQEAQLRSTNEKIAKRGANLVAPPIQGSLSECTLGISQPVTVVTSSGDADHSVLHAGQPKISYRRMESPMGER